MSKVFRAEGGVVAIWNDASDDAPFTDPLNNLSRVKFHSALDYTKVVYDQTVTVNLPSRATSPLGFTTTYTQSYPLFAHGLGIIPLVFASTKIGGVDVAFTGSIPQQSTFGWTRWLTVGADATNVYLYEYSTVGGASTLSALSLGITVWVTDEDLS